METLKTPSDYSVDFNRRFQGFSMANLEKGEALVLQCYTYCRANQEWQRRRVLFTMICKTLTCTLRLR